MRALLDAPAAVVVTVYEPRLTSEASESSLFFVSTSQVKVSVPDLLKNSTTALSAFPCLGIQGV